MLCFCIFVGRLCHHNSGFHFYHMKLSAFLRCVEYCLCAPCISTFLNKPNTWSPIISLVFLSWLILFNHHIIITDFIKELLFSFPSLFVFTLICLNSQVPIHSSALSFSSLTSLQYWSDNMFSLCWGLYFSPSTSNSPELVCHFSCSLSVFGQIWDLHSLASS